MLDPRLVRFEKSVKMRKESTDALIDYWKDFSLYTSFEYWFMVALLLVPLIVLFFKIDKNKIFLIGFFGYSIHVIFAYIDIFGINVGYWSYPIPVIPQMPSISLDSSLVPVTFMLIYQWTLNHKKNYYICSIITAAVFSFLFKPILVEMGLFRMSGKINYIHLFMAYLIVLLGSKLITNVFLWIKKKYGKLHEAY